MQLTTSFVLETLIHAREKPTMLQWMELMTKQFRTCQAACEVRIDSDILQQIVNENRKPTGYFQYVR